MMMLLLTMPKLPPLDINVFPYIFFSFNDSLLHQLSHFAFFFFFSASISPLPASYFVSLVISTPTNFACSVLFQLVAWIS
jgi:hypothetical protein